MDRPKPLRMDKEIITKFQPSRLFQKNIEQGKQYTSLSFDDAGEHLVTTGEDEKLQLFSCRTGKHKKEFPSMKYGAHLVRFAHKSSSVLYASTKNNDTIRYLSLHDNTYIKYFTGHRNKVVSLEVSPTDDTFLSGSIDDTVRLWDTRTSTPQGILNVAGYPTVAYDQTGMIFTVLLTLKNTILMYDLRNFEKEPFLSENFYDPTLNKQLPAKHPNNLPFPTSVRFSNNGKHLLVGTAGSTHYILDAFDARVLGRLHGHIGLENVDRSACSALGASCDEVCWTPDGNYILGGSADGKIHFWDVNGALPSSSDDTAPEPTTSSTETPEIPSLYPIHSLDAHAADGGPSRIVGFNPKYAMFASGGPELAFWLPDKKKKDSENDDKDNSKKDGEESTKSQQDAGTASDATPNNNSTTTATATPQNTDTTMDS